MPAETTPYVSVAFVNRNDNYGGDLAARIAKFIDYYALYASWWPGLFEFVICDWNPPPGSRALRNDYDWAKLGDVVHVTVPPEIHARRFGQAKRPMQDYVGRNVALRRGRGEFSLVLNQDIFISDSIMQLIAKRLLSKTAFYRADRCDFAFEPCRDAAADRFEARALESVFALNRRQTVEGAPLTAPATAETLVALGAKAEEGETFDSKTGVALSTGARARFQQDRAGRREYEKGGRQDLHDWYDDLWTPDYQRRFPLHTNAAGDFLLAPRAAFDEINGLYEATHFYMHLDSYAVIQLFCAGYDQALLTQPHRVFHADHERSRLGVSEKYSWSQHESRLSSILRGDRSYRLNADNWGLADEDLPTLRESANSEATLALATARTE